MRIAPLAVDHDRRSPLLRRHREHDRLDAPELLLVDVDVAELRRRARGSSSGSPAAAPSGAASCSALRKSSKVNWPARSRFSISACSSSATACSARSISVSTSPMPRMRDAIRSGWNTSSCVELLAGRRELDRLAGDRLDAERGAAARVAVELRQDHAVERDALVERLRDVHGLLAGHRVEDEQHVVRLRLVADALELLHQLLVDLEAAGRVDDHRVEPAARARSMPLRVASTASLVSVRKTGTSICSPSCSSWSIAAGRCRSAATRPGLRPWLAQRERELRGGRRLARALEAGEQDDA